MAYVRYRSTEELFWSHVRKGDDCWIFGGGGDQGRYVTFWNGDEKRYLGAHIYSLELATGEKANGRDACHHCDNPPCVRPDHLFWGTQLENRQDSVSKDRHNRGERHGNARLTEEIVIEVRRLAAEGCAKVEIAEQFGITLPHLSRILSRKLWTHV
jgi:hypothetical protein